MGPSKTTPTTGWSAITRSDDQQRLPRCSRAQNSSCSQQPRCVLIAPHSSSRSSTRWWGRLRSAGPAAPPPMNPTPARLLPPATLGWQAPGDLAVLPSLRNHSGGGGVGNKAYLISVAGPPALCRTFGTAASRRPGARRLRYGGGGPQAIHLLPRRARLLRRGWRWQRRQWRRQRRSFLRCGAATAKRQRSPSTGSRH